MSNAIQMNIRIDRSLKQKGDAVLRQNGYSPTKAIKALWTYISTNHELPEFMAAQRKDDRATAINDEINAESGLALKRFQEMTGMEICASNDLSVKELKELAYEEKGYLG